MWHYIGSNKFVMSHPNFVNKLLNLVHINMECHIKAWPDVIFLVHVKDSAFTMARNRKLYALPPPSAIKTDIIMHSCYPLTLHCWQTWTCETLWASAAGNDVKLLATTWTDDRFFSSACIFFSLSVLTVSCFSFSSSVIWNLSINCTAWFYVRRASNFATPL